MKTIAVGVACLLLAACTEEKNLGNTYTLRSARWATSIPVVATSGVVGAIAVAIDPSSDVLAAGGFSGVVDFGEGPIASQTGANWITKRSGADGSHLWTRIFGGSPDANFGLAALRVDPSGNAVIAGNFSGTQPFGDQTLSSGYDNVYVAKVSTNGHTLWVTDFDVGSETQAHAYWLAVGSDGRIYVSGEFQGAINFPNGTASTTATRSWFLAALEPDGTVRWGHQFPAAGPLAVASDGSVIMVAAPRSSTTFGGVSIDLSHDPAQFAARITADGEVSWVHAFGQAGVPYRALKLALDDQDRIAVSSAPDLAGSPTSSQAFLDASGNQLWTAAPLSGKTNERAIATNGHAVLTGGQLGEWSVDLGNGPQIGSMYLAARNPDGSLADANVYGDPSIPSYFTSLAMTATGSVAFTATVAESIDFGSGPVDGPLQNGLPDRDVVIGLFAPEM